VDRIPILRMGRFLLVTIQVDMHDQLALALQDDLTSASCNDRASGVLIDISSLDVVDSFIGRMIATSRDGAHPGRQHVVVGMQPRSPSRSSSSGSRWTASRLPSTSRGA
jgi:rsbT antagonist protein RsbS